MKEGLIYCVRNKAFSHLVKIGKTSKNTVEERELSNSSVPDDFETVFAYKVADIDAVEKAVHKAVEEFRYINDNRRKTEFFFLSAIKKARSVVEPFKISDETDALNTEAGDTLETAGPLTNIDYIEPDSSINDFISWEDIRQMLPKDSPYLTNKNGRIEWRNTINGIRINIVYYAQQQGAWKDKKISKAWLEKNNLLQQLLSIEWDGEVKIDLTECKKNQVENSLRVAESLK